MLKTASATVISNDKFPSREPFISDVFVEANDAYKSKMPVKIHLMQT